MSISEAYDDIERYLIGDEAELPEVLSDLLHVERTLRAIAWRRRKIAQAEMVALAVIDQAQEHLASERKRFDTSFLEHRLHAYHQARLEDDPKAKSLRFPSGELVARKQPDRWEFDEEEFVAWAAQHRADLLRTRPAEVDKPAAKKALRALDSGQVIDGASGEIVPAVTVTPGETSFAIKTEAER